jgi:hypothetical protein
VQGKEAKGPALVPQEVCTHARVHGCAMVRMTSQARGRAHAGGSAQRNKKHDKATTRARWGPQRHLQEEEA